LKIFKKLTNLIIYL